MDEFLSFQKKMNCWTWKNASNVSMIWTKNKKQSKSHFIISLQRYYSTLAFFKIHLIYGSFQNSFLPSLSPTPSSSSSSSPPSVCHPPPTRPPARLLLQTQLRGRLEPCGNPTQVWVWLGETAPNPSTHQPLAFSSPPLLPLRHHCSFLHLSSSSCPIFLLLLASVGQDFHSLCFEPQTWLLRPETDLHWERQSSHLAFSALSLFDLKSPIHQFYLTTDWRRIMPDRITLSLLLYTIWGIFILSVV